jgi:hypothetical protein
MVRGDFHAAIRPKAVCLSGGQFGFVVEAFHDGGGNLPVGPKPVQEQRPMTAEHTHDLLHRLDPRTHHLDTLFVQERRRPIDRAVVPERLEALAEQYGAHGSQIVLHELAQPGSLLARLIRRPFQEQPARLGRERLWSA